MNGSRMNRGLRVAFLSGALLAFGAPAAHATLSWSQTNYDFGVHNPGTAAAPKTFTLTAVCDGELTLPGPTGICDEPTLGGVHSFGSPTVTGAGFTLGMPNTCLIGILQTPTYPGSNTCTTTVNFTPQTVGHHSGTLNLPTGPDIALTGAGAAASGGSGGTKGAVGGKAKKCKKKKKAKRKSAAAAKKKKCGKKKK
jgi:hypothetical protein